MIILYYEKKIIRGADGFFREPTDLDLHQAPSIYPLSLIYLVIFLWLFYIILLLICHVVEEVVKAMNYDPIIILKKYQNILNSILNINRSKPFHKSELENIGKIILLDI